MRPPRRSCSALTAATTALLTGHRIVPCASFSLLLPSSSVAAFSNSHVVDRPFPHNRAIANTRSIIRQKMTAADKAASEEREQVRTIQNDGGDVRMMVHHLASVGSTQDEARRLLKEGAAASTDDETDTETIIKHVCLATSASEQTKGRGTSGRDWVGRGGNTFVTVCIPSSCITSIPMTLLPLKVGVIVSQLVHDRLRERKAWAKVAVKWPNDVLVDDKKIAGILIESYYDEATRESWYLIGVGVNVAHAPTIDLVGPQRGRMPTCLAKHCDIEGDGVAMARELAFDIAKGINEWVASSVAGGEYVDKSIASEAIIREWSDWAEFGKEQVLRDKPGNEVVTPVGIEPDGRLRVRGRTGKEMLLAVDYLL